MTSQVAILIIFSPGMQTVPAGPQPQFAIVRNIDKASGEVTLSQFMVIPEVVQTDLSGKEGIRIVIRQVRHTLEKRFSIDKGTVLDTGGKKVPAAEVWKRLKIGATVLVASQPVDPLYLRIVQPDTLIFITSPLPKLPAPKV
jgi:hypothetical protein